MIDHEPGFGCESCDFFPRSRRRSDRSTLSVPDTEGNRLQTNPNLPDIRYPAYFELASGNCSMPSISTRQRLVWGALETAQAEA